MKKLYRRKTQEHKTNQNVKKKYPKSHILIKREQIITNNSSRNIG